MNDLLSPKPRLINDQGTCLFFQAMEEEEAAKAHQHFPPPPREVSHETPIKTGHIGKSDTKSIPTQLLVIAKTNGCPNA